MSLINWFNKPKWQSPNEQVRITAIQSSDAPELISSLLDIVNNDPSIKVQKTALARVEQGKELVSIALNHPNKAIRTQANKKLIGLFTQHDNPDHLALFQSIKDPETIKAVAELAKSPALRKQAIEQIKQQGLLGELLLKESDTELQKLIIEKIDKPSTLARLQQQAGKKNQTLLDLIQAKLAQHNQPDYNAKAIELCTELEAVVHGKKQLTLTTITDQWQSIEAHIPADIKLRYNGALAAAKMIIDPEHRNQFLKKQKAQRATTELHDLEQQLEKQSIVSLKQAQTAITKCQEIDSTVLDEAALKRHHEVLEQLQQIRAAIQKSQQIPAAVTKTLDQLNKSLSQPIVQPDRLKHFKQQWQKHTSGVKQSEAFNLISQQFNDACLQLAEKIDQSAQQRQQAATEAVAMIEPTIAQIKEGHLVKAKGMTNKMAELKKVAGFNHPTIKQNKYQLDSVWQQLKDLRNWQKWSNDKARQDIIDELLALVGKGLHPDAVLKKLKEANERWYALEDMEKLPGDKFPSRNQKMWGEFRAVSKTLFEPTQPFFEKRSEQQENHLENIEATVKTMNEVDLNDTSEKSLSHLNRDAIKHLKSLDKLPPKQRGVAAKKLRKAINRIDKKLNEIYAVAETKKRKLIAQAQELQGVEDNNAAIESAKQLQQQWKTAGVVKQHTERKLWKKFRQANDAVFNRRDQEQQQQDKAQQALRLQAQALLDDFKQHIKAAKTIGSLVETRTQINKQWNELEKPAALLAHEFNHLLQTISDEINQHKFKALQKKQKNKQQIDDLLTEFEQGKIDEQQKQQQFEQLTSTELTAFFAPRIAAENTEDNQDQLAELLIQAEFLTGLETPEQHMEDRMAYQVKILSERMAGEKAGSDQAQASAWLDQWYLTSKGAAEFIKNNQKRAKKAIKAVMAMMSN